MRPLRAEAPAKINLALQVGPLRTDGFHQIESIICRLDFYDQLTVSSRQDEQVTLTCDDPGLPTDHRNLALSAALRLRELTAKSSASGVALDLQKRIPAGSGLGGGSSDAAAALRLLNEYWRLDFSLPELRRIGQELGSDVPLFLADTPGGAFRVSGRGEVVHNLPWRITGWCALILPDEQCPTALVYRALDELRCEEQFRHTESAPADLAYLESGFGLADESGDLTAATLMPHLFNQLEPAAYRVRPGLGDLAHRIRFEFDPLIRMTGSGAAHFRLFDDHAACSAWADVVSDRFSVRVEIARIR